MVLHVCILLLFVEVSWLRGPTIIVKGAAGESLRLDDLEIDIEVLYILFVPHLHILCRLLAIDVAV